MPLNAFSESAGGVFLSEITEVRPLQLENAQFPILVTLFGMVTEERFVHFLNAHCPMIVTGKFITLQKSLYYLNSNGNQVTIQKRAELHILSRYTHFQRTLLSVCKDNHLFCYHQRNGQELNVFIGFCYLFLGYFMSFSYLFPFGNDFLFLTIGSLSVHYPHGRLLRYWAVLLLP